jgi:hypothetical protein
MNALPWVMSQLLADEHRHELESTAARRRRLATEASRRSYGPFHRRHRDI